MKTRIIIDSTTDVSENLKRSFMTVPLTVHFGDDEYIDGVTINHKRFYEKLIEEDTLPSTSQPTPESFAKHFRAVCEAGEQAVVITISGKLSGTYQSAKIAAMDFPADSIYIVDSKSAAIGAGILAEYALSLSEKGLNAAEIAEILAKERENVRLVALFDTLEFLKRGGRISKTAAVAGGVLSIKPVICIEDGEVKILGKARGSRQGNNLLMQEIAKAGGIDFERPLLLGYTGLNDDLLQKYIADSSAIWEDHLPTLNTAVVGSVVGTHAGPGAIAVAFFKKNL